MSNLASSSYSQILKSSALMGGAQGITMLLGMVRTKFVAMLIGPLGVGLIGNYSAIQGLVGAVAGLGIQSSAVRDVAEAVAKDDPQAIGRTILTLRRMCWLTGLLGALVMISLAIPLSRWTFENESHVVDIALLGVVILLSNISGGQMALIQGMRRIGELAQLQIIGAVGSTVTSVGCYFWLGLRGIVPALLLMAFIQLLASWYFARRIPVPEVVMTWRESIFTAGGMIRLGLSFMWTSLAESLVAFLTRVLITQQISLEAVGIFGAASVLSGMFVSFVLGSMGSDFYPRLAAVASDRDAVNKLVNEQTEIGLLLAVPGLLVTLSLAPWVIRLFYTDAFLPAAGLLQWLVLGCLGQVISHPMGFMILALGKGKWFFLTETLFHVLHLVLIWEGLRIAGFQGVAIAYFVVYLAFTTVEYLVVRYLTGFCWSAATRRLLFLLLPLVALTFLTARWLPIWQATALGLVVSTIASVLCLQGLVQRLGVEHRIVRAACRIPGMRYTCGLSTDVIMIKAPREERKKKIKKHKAKGGR